MSDDTTRNATTGGDTLRSLDITTSKIQGMSLVVDASGVGSGAVSRSRPLASHGTDLFTDVAGKFGRMNASMRGLVDSLYRRRQAGAAVPGPVYAGGVNTAIESLAWTSLWEAPYSGGPWSATASAGASATTGALIDGNTPSVGTAVNGYTPADFDGVSFQYFHNGTLDTTLLTPTGGTIIALVAVRSAAAATGNIYDDAGILINLNSNQGLNVSASGVQAYAYDGAYKSVVTAIDTNFHLVMSRWNGSLLRLNVDSAVEQSVACGTLTMGGDSIAVAQGYSGLHYLDGRILTVGTLAYSISDAEYQLIKTNRNAKFGLSL